MAGSYFPAFFFRYLYHLITNLAGSRAPHFFFFPSFIFSFFLPPYHVFLSPFLCLCGAAAIFVFYDACSFLAVASFFVSCSYLVFALLSPSSRKVYLYRVVSFTGNE